jgi:hypothetical protein
MIHRDPLTGRESFVQNPQFEKVKADYNARMAADGKAPVDDYTIAQEIFAEFHAHYFESPEFMQRAVRGHVPSDLVSENTLNSFFHKTGLGTDAITGNPIATSNLEGAKDLQTLVKNYYKLQQYKKLPVTEGYSEKIGPTIPVGNIVKGTEAFDRIVKNLSDTGDIVRNTDGSIKVDDSGRPIVKNKKEADAEHAKLADHVIQMALNQPGLTSSTNPNGGLRIVTDRPTTPGGKGRTLIRTQDVPDAVFDQLVASNQYNPNQINNWRRINGLTARDDGTATSAVYNTATTRKGRYATLAATERTMVPLWTEINMEGAKQVNVQMYDPEQMVKNVTKMMNTAKGKKLWDSVGPAYDDVRTYLDNLVNNRPGETGLGLEKKGIINEMFGINADANPLVSDVTGKARSASVFKTMRLDRMNQVTELRDTRQVRADTYEKVRSFMQPREGQVAPGTETRYQPREGEASMPAEPASTGSGQVSDVSAMALHAPGSILANLSFGKETLVNTTPNIKKITTPRGKEYNLAMHEYSMEDGRKRFLLSAGDPTEMVDAGAIVKEQKDGAIVQMINGGHTFNGLGGVLAKQIKKKYGIIYQDKEGAFTEVTKRHNEKLPPTETNKEPKLDALKQPPPKTDHDKVDPKNA